MDLDNYNHISFYKTVHDIKQYFPENNKQKFGAVFTSYHFIDTMFTFIDEKYFKNKHLKWCDMGCGLGYFTIYLYFKLMEHLVTIENITERCRHIIENMLYMIDIQEEYIPFLKKIFGENANIYCRDFLDWEPTIKFDFIIGNPPFHSNHIKQVPTNKEKKEIFTNSETIWPKFIFKADTLLQDNGRLLVVIPSLWCKFDSYGIYNYLIKRLEKVRLYNNTEINKLFHYQAQTPCSILLSRKKENEDQNKYQNKDQNENKTETSISSFLIYDCFRKDYIDFNIYFEKQSIPIKFPLLFKKMNKYCLKYGNMRKYCFRSKMPSIKVKLQDEITDNYKYKNIHSTILNKKTDISEPLIVCKYSNISCSYYRIPKIVLAHKMYGFPYYDVSGNFGISNRDNYVIIDLTDDEFKLMVSFTSSILFIFILECFKYRMKMIEPCFVEYFPNITKMKINFSNNIENIDEFWFDVFDVSIQERDYICNHFSKKYLRIPRFE